MKTNLHLPSSFMDKEGNFSTEYIVGRASSRRTSTRPPFLDIDCVARHVFLCKVTMCKNIIIVYYTI